MKIINYSTLHNYKKIKSCQMHVYTILPSVKVKEKLVSLVNVIKKYIGISMLIINSVIMYDADGCVCSSEHSILYNQREIFLRSKSKHRGFDIAWRFLL